MWRDQMNNYAASGHIDDNEDLWHVQLATGEVRPMTLDQLDEAFQDGIVNEETFVFQEETNRWAKLGEVAGLGADDDEAIEIETPDHYAPAPQASVWPVVAASQSYVPPSGYGQLGAGPGGYSSVGPKSTAPVVSEIDDFDLEFSSAQFRRKK